MVLEIVSSPLGGGRLRTDAIAASSSKGTANTKALEGKNAALLSEVGVRKALAWGFSW